MASKTLIKGGRVVDPKNEIDGRLDVLIEGSKIIAVEKRIETRAEIIDADGMIVAPGLIDIHVHLREPGREDEETIESGCRAAVKGGFTTIACMPNTDPVNDDAAVTKYITEKAAGVGLARVLPIAAITKGLSGEELTEMGSLVAAGAVAFSDDGRCVQSPALMRRALEYSKIWDIPLIVHAEEESLSEGGQVNEGFYSTILGLKGIPAEAEEIVVVRDLLLAELTGGRLHIAHVSSPGSLKFIKSAKKRGVRATCEVTPHHLTLSDGELVGYDTNFKVNPPLRSENDVAALRTMLADDSLVDCIASDHAPHARHEKEREFARAPFGMIGLETALSVVLTKLVETGAVTLNRAIEMFTAGPARALGMNAGGLGVGDRADIVIIDPEAELKVNPSAFESKSRNTPYAGMRLKGLATTVLVDGKLVMQNREIIDGHSKVRI